MTAQRADRPLPVPSNPEAGAATGAELLARVAIPTYITTVTTMAKDIDRTGIRLAVDWFIA